MKKAKDLIGRQKEELQPKRTVKPVRSRGIVLGVGYGGYLKDCSKRWEGGGQAVKDGRALNYE